MNALRLLALGLVLSLVAGCKDEGGAVCAKIYERETACEAEEAAKDPDAKRHKRKEFTKDQFVTMCKAMRSIEKEEFDLLASCLKKDSCEEMNKCQEAGREAEYAKEKVIEVNEALAAKDWSEAFDSCKYLHNPPDPTLLAACNKVYVDGIPELMKDPKTAEDVVSSCRYSDDLKKSAPEFGKACVAVMTIELEAKTKLAIVARDAGDDSDYSLCSDLKQAAEGVSAEATKQAETLCAEISAAASIKKAIEDASTSIAAKKADTSFYCSMAAETVSKLEKTEWAKKAADDLFKVCYLDLGKIVFEVALADEYPSCYSVQQIREGVTMYALTGKDPAFDALLAQVEAKCPTPAPVPPEPTPAPEEVPPVAPEAPPQ